MDKKCSICGKRYAYVDIERQTTLSMDDGSLYEHLVCRFCASRFRGAK